MGRHIILEMYGCPSKLIAFAPEMKTAFDKIIKEAELNRVSEAFHQFKPHGVTAIVLLEESHISMHTWPEFGYVAMDIYTCGKEGSAEKAAELAEQLFMPEKVLKNSIKRGLENETGLK